MKKRGAFLLTVATLLLTGFAGGVLRSTPFSIPTAHAQPPAPTNIYAVTTGSVMDQPPKLWYHLSFSYNLQADTQSFNIYRKRPTDASYAKYTYNAQTSVNPSILPLPASDESNLYHRETSKWEWWTTLPAPVPSTAIGDYQFYVTAVDTSGVESSPSETKSFKLYAAPTISSPADGSTTSLTPQVTFSGDPSVAGQSYNVAIYKQTNTWVWTSAPPSPTSFVYSGPALSANDNPHRLVAWSSASINSGSLY